MVFAFFFVLFGGLAWDGYQVVFRRRVALPVRTLGTPLYVELAKDPKTFWLICGLHAAVWALLAFGVIRAIKL